MKATLEFNLGDPDDKMAHLRCVKSLDMALVLWELQHGNFRREVYREMEDGNMSEEAMAATEVVMTKIIELLLNHNINTEEFIV